MAILKNTTIPTTTNITIPSGPSIARSGIVTTVIQWTNTGTQAGTVLTGNSPTFSNTTWTCPTGVTQVEVLVVAGGGVGGDRKSVV